MAVLVITVEVDVDPRAENSWEIARYLLDDRADDPVGGIVSAEWLPVEAWGAGETKVSYVIRGDRR